MSRRSEAKADPTQAKYTLYAETPLWDTLSDGEIEAYLVAEEHRIDCACINCQHWARITGMTEGLAYARRFWERA